MRQIVLDTNSLIQSLPARSPYHRIWTDYLSGKLVLCVTTSILNEYEEILSRLVGKTAATDVINVLLNNSSTRMVNTYYDFNLIEADPDDNKFVDCAIASGAELIVTEDRHFNVLKTISFPKVFIIDLDGFIKTLS